MNKKEIAEYSEKIIKCEELYKNSDMNKSDIVEYCEKIRLEQKPDIAATILYIKDTLKRYNTYYPDISIGSNVFINYSSMKNNKDDPKLLEEMTEFKNIKEKDLRGLFQAVTSCYLIDDPYNKILIPSRTLCMYLLLKLYIFI
ncbi:uncharacterized protein LOC103309626 [Acyrthosiphon pisum]|uniref:Uncharacterized protein n=1 Tax=Acyrthosiphon pisum TaxID=7029 RepID=A0A8R2D443_ACYPI|nr:uncharacterized protein LOC103309626 [Acyrthosiphon pisum]|eukprot:XP_016660428.1 PREDICTED: uncharacterized protein LOC103309626 [Acyrthosiphon pisum]